jgi:hypothetical protein
VAQRGWRNAQPRRDPREAALLGHPTANAARLPRPSRSIDEIRSIGHPNYPSLSA